MPHSSGGRSHGSRSSRSRSRSKAADMRFGSTYYPGSRRYRYLRNGAPAYYYSDRPYSLQEAKKEKRKSIFSSFITAVMGIIFAVAGLFGLPHKVRTDYNTEIVIRDTAELLTAAEEKDMSDAFGAFLDKTGVTPAFFTITGEDKQSRSLESYAYSLYVNTFDDEKHWLIVYCPEYDGNSWDWEGMIGNDCESIITGDLEDELTERLRRNLENDPENISGAVIDAFNTIAGKTGGFSFKNFRGVGLTLLFGLVCLFVGVKKFTRTVKTDPAADPRINSEQDSEPETGSKPEPAAEVKAAPEAEPKARPETITCEHCGGEFAPGDQTVCPYCGAPLEKWD